VTMAIALYFAHVTALQTSAYSIGFGSMQRELGMTNLQAAAGVALYGWVSKSWECEHMEADDSGIRYRTAVSGTDLGGVRTILGIRWSCLGLWSMPSVLDSVSGARCSIRELELIGSGQNVATVLVGRWFQGLSGCIGATVVAGTVSDLYPPAK
jgi:MFS family permease